MFPSQIICCLVFILTGVQYSGCEDPSPPEHSHRSFISTIESFPSLPEEGGVKSKEYIFGEINVSEMALETVTGSKDEACLTKDFVAVPEIQHRGPLACGEEGLVYRVRITNCGSGTLTLTGFNFLFEIPKIMDNEDAERRLFDGDMTRMYRLRDIRLCNTDNSEWCWDATVERISEKSAKISVVLSDEEVIALESKKDQGFDIKVVRNCTRTTTSLLRLDTQLIEVKGVNDVVRKDENIFGGIFNPRQKNVISGWEPHHLPDVIR